MKAAGGSWVRVSLFVLLPMLAVLVIGVALLVGLLLDRAFDQSFEPAPTTWPTPDTVLATATVTSPAEPTPEYTALTRIPDPTMEPQATESSLPESTPEPTRHSTNTPDPTPSQSHTPSVRIRTFAASPNPVERSGTVTLTWDAPGAESAGITRLSPEGDIFLATEALDLPAQGSIDLQVPDDYVISVKYYLGARDADGVLAKAYVTVGVICSYKEYVAPRCPLTQDHLWAAYEPFEHGHMIWRSDSREIYVLYDDGGYETYTDTWQEGDPVDVSGTPPTGMYAPVRGFGNLYANQPEIRGRLGWATDPEVGYTMWVETIPGGSGRYPGISTYFTLPDGSVVNLYPFTSTWKRMP